MSEVTLTIDGVTTTVPAGTNLVDAAKQIGISIPVFCYHPRLSAVGMCRMCLVGIGMPKRDRATGQFEVDEDGNPVIAMLPKLQTACTTTVSEGMVAYTCSEAAKAAQKGIVEFLLTSHPLDCPVCDKGGECPLQNLTMQWGPGKSRFDYSEKLHQEKPIALGDLILLDRERCIICSRCVRFQTEIADDEVLGFDNRGRYRCIISESDPPFDSKYSGNTTDICPVGALTTRDFRFRARVWELTHVPAICTHCSVGCNITFDMRLGKVNRIMPRENGVVNDIWICDKGRFGHRFIESDQRLTRPLIRKDGQFVEASWEEAINLIAERFAATYQKRVSGGDAFAGIAGERLSNEDLFLFQRFFRNVLKSNNIDHRIGTPGETANDDFGVALGVGTGTNLMKLGKGTTVLVVGADPEEEAPLYMLRLRGIAKRGGKVIVANTRSTKLDHSATLSIHYRPGNEQPFVRGVLSAILNEISIQRLPARTTYNQADIRSQLNAPVSTIARSSGVSEKDIRAIATACIEAENLIIVYGSDAMASGTGFVQDLSNLMVMTGKVGLPNSGLIALLPWGNSRGALDMGVRHDQGPGYPHLYTVTQIGKAKTTTIQSGLSAREMWTAAVEGRIRSFYIIGQNPVREYPSTRTAIEKLDFLVVQDLFLTETARLADVVLPSAASVERDGTYTNAERRVQRTRKACQAPGEARPDWEIIQDIARAVLDRLDDTQGQTDSADKKEKKKKGKGSGHDKHRGNTTWNYMDVSDVTDEIAATIDIYKGITYAALNNAEQPTTWGREQNSFYYDGTSYHNNDSVGIQYSTPAERANANFAITLVGGNPQTSDKRYPFTLLVQKLLYDGDLLLHGSLLQAHVPQPYVVLNETDAEKLDINTGDYVIISSLANSIEMRVKIEESIPEGSIMIPAHLPKLPLSEIQTGPLTRVALQKKEN